MVTAMLGVLKAGAAYLPLDPAHPAARLTFALTDSAAGALVTDTRLLSRFPSPPGRVVCVDSADAGDATDGAPPCAATAEDLAYVIYTSGSTGTPNGVRIGHRAVVNFLTSMARRPGITAEDVLVAVTTYAFDIAVLEIWLPLTSGAQVVLATASETTSGGSLARLLDGSRATLMQATPATWQMLIDSGWSGRRELVALCGGEALAPQLAAALLTRVGVLWNMYGPTETTVWSTLARVEPGQAVTIGRPIANTRVYVLDANLQPVPVGVRGEIYIGGDGLTAGYLNRSELNAQRIVPDPWVPGAFMYRTGDAGRHLSDGRLEHLGRLDHQVKVRGFRIEPGEVETALLTHPSVDAAVVMAREDTPGDRRLVAYVVAASDPPAASDLRSHLRAMLPDHMIPSVFVTIDSLPRTPNGKLDRAALPAPETDGASGDAPSSPPRTQVEQRLSEIWARALNVDRVGVDDNFFDLGGHSLLAVRLRVDVEKDFGCDIPLGTIFNEAATVAGMAALIEAGGHGRA